MSEGLEPSIAADCRNLLLLSYWLKFKFLLMFANEAIEYRFLALFDFETWPELDWKLTGGWF
jgi:hypothetical protein